MRTPLHSPMTATNDENPVRQPFLIMAADNDEEPVRPSPRTTSTAYDRMPVRPPPSNMTGAASASDGDVKPVRPKVHRPRGGRSGRAWRRHRKFEMVSKHVTGPYDMIIMSIPPYPLPPLATTTPLPCPPPP